MKILKLTLLFLIISYYSFGQKTINSTQIFQILETAQNLRKTKPDSALLLFKKAERAAIKLDDKNAIMHCYYDLAYFLFTQNKNKESYILFEKALILAEKLKNDEYYYKSKIYIGTYHLITSNYNLATEYCIDALAYFEKEKNYLLVSGISLNLTFIQIEQKDYDSALEYAKSSLRHAQLIDNRIYVSKSYSNMGEVYLLKNNYDKAIFYFKESLRIIEA